MILESFRVEFDAYKANGTIYVHVDGKKYEVIRNDDISIILRERIEDEP